jgi:hypothetical protein
LPLLLLGLGLPPLKIYPTTPLSILSGAVPEKPVAGRGLAPSKPPRKPLVVPPSEQGGHQCHHQSSKRNPSQKVQNFHVFLASFFKFSIYNYNKEFLFVKCHKIPNLNSFLKTKGVDIIHPLKNSTSPLLSLSGY